MVDDARHIIKPKTLDIYSSTSNKPIDLLVSLIQFPPINDAVRRSLQYDFAAQQENAIAGANRALTRQLTPELYLAGSVDKISAERVEAGPDGLLALIDLHGIASLHSGQLPK